jgi:sugar phosphate isomerase/epimerase
MTRVWDRRNLHAWTVAPFDAVDRSPEQRVAMIARLGFARYAYSWRERHVPTFEAEIEATKRYGIQLMAWNFLALEPEDPLATAILELCRSHAISPELWVMQSHREGAGVRSDHRVELEADRIRRFVVLAAPYGCRVALYNHNGWLGMLDNQLLVLDRLAELGVSDVGIVYNFSHARDDGHDDTKDFPALWVRILPYVTAVNVTGTAWEGTLLYPSEGDAELEMMRTIEQSGWRGPVGLIAERGGDAELTLRNCLIGFDWLAAELAEPGSGGNRPFT